MFLPGVIRDWLEQKKGYLRWRYHPSVINSWLFFRPAVKKQLTRQRKLYLEALSNVDGSSKLVFDIGANEGYITGIFLEAGYNVVAVEPAERNLSILHARFDKKSQIKILPVAIAQRTGSIDFFESSQHALGTASSKWSEFNRTRKVTGSDQLPKQVEALSLDDMIDKFGKPVFVKIDVEGYELEVLKGLSKVIPLISFEAILPLFLQESLDCIDRIYQLNKNVQFNYAANDCMQWTGFRNREELVKELERLSPQTVEIFCRS
jgi:FkbM family methyltransferase